MSDSSVNAVNSNRTPERLEQMAEHEAATKENEKTFRTDWFGEVQLLVRSGPHCLIVWELIK